LSTRITRQVETIKIFNQPAGFKDWWIGGGLEFFQPALVGWLKILPSTHPTKPVHTPTLN